MLGNIRTILENSQPLTPFDSVLKKSALRPDKVLKTHILVSGHYFLEMGQNSDFEFRCESTVWDTEAHNLSEMGQVIWSSTWSSTKCLIKYLIKYYTMLRLLYYATTTILCHNYYTMPQLLYYATITILCYNYYTGILWQESVPPPRKQGATTVSPNPWCY